MKMKRCKCFDINIQKRIEISLKRDELTSCEKQEVIFLKKSEGFSNFFRLLEKMENKNF